MEVIKFGGSSLVNAAAMRQVADVLEARKAVPKFVVLSVWVPRTVCVCVCGQEAKQGSSDWKSMVDELHVRHREACESLIEGASQEAVLTEIEEGMAYIRSICEGLQLLHEFTDHTRDALVSMGERLSVPLMHALTTRLQCGALDSQHGGGDGRFGAQRRGGDGRVCRA